MKREMLKELGLTDDQIDKIMAENGKDIEKHKAAVETAKAEADGLRTQLTDAGKRIEAFKGMDIEGIKKAADEWKTKSEQAEKNATAQVVQLRFDHALDGVLTGVKARNPKAVKALLDMENLKLNEADGTIVGLEDQLKKIKEANDYLFENETPTPKIVAGVINQPVGNISAFEAAARRGAGLPLQGK